MKRTNEEIIAVLKQVMDRLDVYNDQLKEHMSRTALLEAAVAAQEKHHTYTVSQLDERTLRIYNTLDERINKQEAHLHGLPAKAVQYIAILSGLGALVRALL